MPKLIQAAFFVRQFSHTIYDWLHGKAFYTFGKQACSFDLLALKVLTQYVMMYTNASEKRVILYGILN